MIKDTIHTNICKNFDKVEAWFKDITKDLCFPIYSSFDIRESNFKVAPVDANIFPAGFNNICAVDKDSAIKKMGDYMSRHYPAVKGNLCLVTEAHTKNAYYWENVKTIANLLERNNFKLQIAIPSEMRQESINVETVSGDGLSVNFIYHDEGILKVNGEVPNFIVSNNDFSSIFESWKTGIRPSMSPQLELGWYNRKKSSFFDQYNKLAIEFSSQIDLPAEHLVVNTEPFEKFDIGDEGSRDQLAERVDTLVSNLTKIYKENSIEETPFVFVKNSSGTYGLGIQQVSSGEEVRNWSYKARKKMKAVKGGGQISELILQEGIPTVHTSNDETAEPSIYMIGKELAGGFLRTHSKKGPKDNLNSPGAIYKKLCISDLQVQVDKCPMENVYGWVAKLGSVAIAREAQASGVDFPDYVI